VGVTTTDGTIAERPAPIGAESPAQRTAVLRPLDSGNERVSRTVAIALVIVVLLLFAAIRWRLRTMPLERDEGEYAYAGQLLLQGIPPYQMAYNMKLPGTYAVYALILRVFGETAAGIHLGLLLANAAATILIYLVGRKLYGRLGAVTAAASYALLSASETVMGLSGHATHFAVLMALPGILILLGARENKQNVRYFTAGVFMGLAFVMKQPGAAFILLGLQEILWNAWHERSRWKSAATRTLAYIGGAALPYTLTGVWLYRAGVFAKFWFWTVSYAGQYAAVTGIVKGILFIGQNVPPMFFAAPLIWCLAAFGFAAVLTERKAGGIFRFEAGLLLWSFVATSAGFYYRHHYFILLLPALSLLTGKAMEWLTELLETRTKGRITVWTPVLVFAAAYLISLYVQRDVFFRMTPAQVVRFRYGGNPFPEAVEFGKYIRDHAAPHAKIAVLGSEPEICFYANRKSATGYIYMYPLMEEQKFAEQMQSEMIREVEQARPEYLVKVVVNSSWLSHDNSDKTVLQWAEKYAADDYSVVGVAEISRETKYYWDAAAVGVIPQTRYSMFLYRRKS
jgi:hypothetical protein